MIIDISFLKGLNCGLGIGIFFALLNRLINRSAPKGIMPSPNKKSGASGDIMTIILLIIMFFVAGLLFTNLGTRG